jgi:hypothetical protein
MFFVVEWKPSYSCLPCRYTSRQTRLQHNLDSVVENVCLHLVGPRGWLSSRCELAACFTYFFLSLHVASAVIIFINLLCGTERENEEQGWRCGPPVLHWPPRCFNCAKPLLLMTLCAEVVAGKNGTLHTVYRWLTLPVARVNVCFLRGFLKFWRQNRCSAWIF